jgi:8-oxo-dGTP pyrophosphatase MutT (NUDIX family)
MTAPASWNEGAVEFAGDFRIFKLQRVTSQHPDGRTGNFVRVQSPDWVNVIAVNQRREIALVRQYRHGTSRLEWEIPGGMIDADEEPLTGGVRELREETGIGASLWVQLGTIDVNPAFMTNRCHTWLAWDAGVTGATDFDDNEEIELAWTPFEQLVEMLRDGRISHGVVVAAFGYWALRFGGMRMPTTEEVRAVMLGQAG